MNRLILLLFLLSSSIAGIAQLTQEEEEYIVRLKGIIANAEHDSTIINAWREWDNIIYLSDPDLDLQLTKQIDSLSSLNLKKDLSPKEALFFSDAQGYASNVFGEIYREHGNDSLAINYYAQAIKLFKQSGNKSGLGAAYNNLGIVYQYQGNYSNAIEYYTLSLKLMKETGYHQGVANTLNNIGNIHNELDDFEKAIEFHKESLEIRTKIEDKHGIAMSLSNIANNFQYKGAFEEANEYYAEALEIAREIGDKQNEANVLGNMGKNYREQGKVEEGLELIFQGLEIKKDLGEQKEIIGAYGSIATCYEKLGNTDQAIHYAKLSYDLAIKRNSITVGTDAARLLYQAYSKKGRYKEALEMYEFFIMAKDSLTSEENQRAVIQQEYRYAYEKQAHADSITNAEAKKVQDALLAAEHAENKHYQAEVKQQRQQAYFLYGILALAILFGGFIFNRFKVTKRQKKHIELQKEEVTRQKELAEKNRKMAVEQKDMAIHLKEEVEEKNKEITDSITYAKRIQSAIFPPQKLVKEYLRDSFILYKPKDIVAGDFYWLEHKDGKILYAAADCTGHGVPGALVSVICNNGLNRSVRENGLTDPGQILDKTREIIIQEFDKSEEVVADGMDAALCVLDGMTLQYAGANNPLWIIRNGELLETKADKQPIGRYDRNEPFKTHTIELQKGDSIYIFSDGYADQFGGIKGKKLKTSNFKKLLLEIQGKSMECQRQELLDQFEKWRGNFEQIDDVCIIGVRV